ncbi:hypothetical protein SASPL_144795 [Salvia splendens]|uniref:Myb/SANT-like domain-containing protein n=1 Tax=Salvia splendens TaxID=180675 RepID=A0A8X8Z7S3_SALSN|nr:hypothetical protein SASPL_144795 [Salvia splendens]
MESSLLLNRGRNHTIQRLTILLKRSSIESLYWLMFWLMIVVIRQKGNDHGAIVQVAWDLTVVLAGSSRQKFRKGDRSRRMWTQREEEILAATLLELVARGWKSDNGFRAGYQTKCEDAIRAEFPNSDLKAYASKSWPLWETWKLIFGKDRASGRGSEDLEAAATRMRSQLAGGSQCNENDYYPSFENFIDPNSPMAGNTDVNDTSSGNGGKEASINKTSSGSRKKESSDAVLMEFLGNLHAETNARLEMISARIGYDFDMGKARQDVFEKLGMVEGLTLPQRYLLCNILGDKPQRLEVFMGMQANARLGYVLCLIDEYRKEG